ncbi:hemophore-related protein [Nocardia aurantiaca]|uniref:Hemophore-related protein n=1 Tax=Nocardia aurantiaca TaxID=2675850 RepID=A0A6I3KPW9_9NOCA|nr:hemophore-related protein [Nocardia aurantiaca]MTE11361.1 hemophore-related protein [Nocardia aurantiaca]
MSFVRNRRAGVLFGAGAVAAVALTLAPATASASPADLVAPLLNSTCTFTQVDAALHDKAPALAQFLDQNPDTKAELKAKFDQSPAERQAELDQYLKDNPDAADQAAADPRAGGIAAAIQQVADTCHNY